jgi:uncharacterized protein (DUF2252 family)
LAIEISTEGETQMITDGVEAGRARRADLPRSEHGRWQPAADRRDPVAILEEQGETRVEDLLPIRYQRMLVSPFTFYRGGAAIMAADLASQPNSGMIVQLCGDAHLSNFGVFASPDRRLVFSVNDFDETLPGPFEWDVKRLAASLAVAGRDLDILVSDRMDIVARCVGTYRRAILDLSGRPFLDLWYARIDEQAIVNRLDGRVSAKRRKEFDKNVAKAQAKDHLRALSKLTELVEGRPRFISDPPIIVPIEELAPGSDAAALNARWQEIFASYCESLPHDRRRLLQRFNYAHAARKVVGVGSVGTRAWIVLLTGRDGTDPLFLQFKEAQASVLEPFVDESEFENCGQRVVEGQRLMQAASDVMLGWIRTVGPDGVERDFYVRQLWDAKGSARVETMDSRTLAAYAELCGWALAEAHARSADVSAISGYLGTGESFDRSIASFAELYADRNDDDYQQFRRAAADGRVAVASA